MSRLLVRGGTILTSDVTRPVAESLLIDGDRVVAVGDEDEVGASAAGAELLDLAGGVACPGFVDAHSHFVLAILAELGADCRVPAVESVEHLLEVVRESVGDAAPGAWVRGWGYNEFDLGRHPTLRELDAAAPDNPLVIGHASGHACVANSAALVAAGIKSRRDDPPGGLVERDRRGNPTGVLHEQAAEAVEVLARTNLLGADPEAALRAAHGVARRYASLGLTTICDPCVPVEVEPLFDAFVVDPDFPLLLTGLGIGSRGMFAAPTEWFAEQHTGPFVPSGVKLFADGGEQCSVCMSLPGAARLALRALASALQHRTLLGARLLSAPVTRLGWDGRVHAGLRFHRDEELVTLLRRAADGGLVGAVHAMGNGAVDQVLDAVEEVRRSHGEEPRLRMEHVMMPDERSLDRIAPLGISAVVQPRFVHEFGFPMLLTGSNREFRVLAFRDLLDQGVLLAGSSDAPVANPAVLPAIESAVTRATAQGDVLDADQALTVEEGLALYTANAAAVLGLAGSRGVLRPGAKADLVILSEDPRQVPPHEIGSIRVERTYRSGRCTFDASVPVS